MRKIVQSDLLPSAGLIYAVNPNMNIRLNYSQTIARPSFRELAAYYSYDPIINDFVEGNPTPENDFDRQLRCAMGVVPPSGRVAQRQRFLQDIGKCD